MIVKILATCILISAITPRTNEAQSLTSTHGDHMREADKTSSVGGVKGKDEIGNRYTRLLVLEHIGKDKHGNKVYRCQCDCGQFKDVRGSDLRTGNTTSCGCLGRENSRARWLKHGLTETPEYLAWQALKNRCYREKDEHFSNYGGRGITVCDEWRNDFAAFYAHVGPRPSPQHSIHRKENNGNYEPGNVVWTTQDVQCNNRTSNRILEYGGKSQTLIQWSRETGLNCSTILLRIKAGWSVERALTAPIQRLKRRMI